MTTRPGRQKKARYATEPSDLPQHPALKRGQFGVLPPAETSFSSIRSLHVLPYLVVIHTQFQVTDESRTIYFVNYRSRMLSPKEADIRGTGASTSCG